ncbi:MAG: two-component sensor histidine kinase, partial [Stackebrandtia sp.]
MRAGPTMIGVGAHDPDEFSAGQWPDWSFWKDRPDGPRSYIRGRVVVALATGLAPLTLIARADEIAHRTTPPLLASLAIGLVACYGIACMPAAWYG